MIQIANIKSTDTDLNKKLDEALRQVLNRPDVGFPKLAADEATWKAVANRAEQVRGARTVLVVGIGGSSLGPQVLDRCFMPTKKFLFLESPDPHTWKQIVDVNPSEAHVVLISKSGNTLETLTWAERLHAADPKFLKNATVIASPGEGPLQMWAKRAGVEQLTIPTSVGGRFSVLTPVGMFPAALMGLNLAEFRSGIAWAVDHPQLATQLSAAVIQSWARGEWITQMWTYSESLRLFGEWWQQLWGESLGKRQTRDGKPAPRASTPMACSGPRDQHSLVQQLMEGARDKFVFVNRVAEVETGGETFKPSLYPQLPFAGRAITLGNVLSAEAAAFEKSLAETGIPFVSIQLDRVIEKTLGAYFMLWQMTVAQLGEYIGIDAFNQPGVELGKKYAAQLVARE